MGENAVTYEQIVLDAYQTEHILMLEICGRCRQFYSLKGWNPEHGCRGNCPVCPG